MIRQLIEIAAGLTLLGVTTTANAQWSVGSGCPGGVCPRPIQPPYQQPFQPYQPPQVSAPPEVQLAPHVRGSIVRIANAVGRGYSLGSGTLVDKNAEHGLVLTCAHLFDDGVGTINVTFPASAPVGARLIAIEPSADLAALLIHAPPADAVPVAIDAPRRGEVITSCGYGGQGQLACNRGLVLGYGRLNNSPQAETLEISGWARQGDSGGPMLNLRNELVGVLFGASGRSVDGTCCTRIRQFLAPHARRFRPQQPPQTYPAPVVPSAPPRPIETPAPQPPVVVTAPPAVVEPPVVPNLKTPAPSAPPTPIAAPAPSAPIPATKPSLPTAPIAAAESWLSGKLVALLVGVGLPGWLAIPAVWLAMRRADRHLQARLNPPATSSTITTDSSLSKTSPTPTTTSPAIILHTESPPLPQVVERNREFVQVRVPTQRLEALQWAMDEIARRNPGMQGTVEMIESYASQYQSGLKKRAREMSAVS